MCLHVMEAPAELSGSKNSLLFSRARRCGHFRAEAVGSMTWIWDVCCRLRDWEGQAEHLDMIADRAQHDAMQ